MMQNIPSNQNTRRIGWIGLLLLLLGCFMALTGLYEGVSGLFLFGMASVDDIGDRILILVTLVVTGTAAFFAGIYLLRSWQREREGLAMIDWLGEMDDLAARIRYPVTSDLFRPVGEWISRLVRDNRGWILLAHVPGLLISGEVVRRKYLQVLSSVGLDWDAGWGESQLREKLDDPSVDRFHAVSSMPSKKVDIVESCAAWVVRSKDGDLAIGFLIALPLGRKYVESSFLNTVVSVGLSSVIKRLGVLLVDVVDRRSKLGSEGLGLLYRMLVHEMSKELQGVKNLLAMPEKDASELAGPLGVKSALQAYLGRSITWLDIMKDAPLLQDNWTPTSARPIPLDETIREVVEEVRLCWPEITFSVKGVRGLCILADSQVRSILRNIIFNAASFSPDDGIVSVIVSSTPEFARIRVRDEGMGVSEEISKILFDASVPSEKRPNGYKGMGVGLALARAVARAFGGDIICTPTFGKGGGGDFEISLPLDH